MLQRLKECFTCLLQLISDPSGDMHGPHEWWANDDDTSGIYRGPCASITPCKRLAASANFKAIIDLAIEVPMGMATFSPDPLKNWKNGLASWSIGAKL